MSLAHNIAPGAPIFIDAPKCYMRSLTEADASARWATWLDQPEVQEALNLPARKNTKANIIAYIRKFDNDTNLLLGIFDKGDDLMVGIITVSIDRAQRTYLANTFIGEADRRHKGFMLDLTPPFRDYFFDVRGLDRMLATALATNTAIRNYLHKTGWTLDKTLKAHTKSHVDGSMLDLCCYSITRAAWHAWRAANLRPASPAAAEKIGLGRDKRA
jgi:RimJ/RimL family protein N-acetyltransferase